MAVAATAWISDGSPLSPVCVVASKRAANGPASAPQRPPTGTDRPPKEEDLSFGSGGVEDRGDGGGPEAAPRPHLPAAPRPPPPAGVASQESHQHLQFGSVSSSIIDSVNNPALLLNGELRTSKPARAEEGAGQV
eukprot:SM004015S15415  [mRNA]  locus=s4015:121:1242:+ [translate_table: standard]